MATRLIFEGFSFATAGGGKRSHGDRLQAAAIVYLVAAVATIAAQAQLQPTQRPQASQTARAVVSTGALRSNGNAARMETSNKIQHFVFIIKENRTFDSYFGQFPGADGATQGTMSTGQVVPLNPMPDITPHGLDHTSEGALTDIDNGKMDGFDLPPMIGATNDDLLWYRQFTQAGIPNYWAYAQNFVLADHMFSSMYGPSFANHLYTVAAQSGGVLEIPLNEVNPNGVGPENLPCLLAAKIDVLERDTGIKRRAIHQAAHPLQLYHLRT
jgi:phospholipase C